MRQCLTNGLSSPFSLSLSLSDFDCSTTESYYNLNENLYKPGKGIDGSDVLMSPLDMMTGLMMAGPMGRGGGGGGSTDNTIDGGDAMDDSEGDKTSSKTNNADMGFGGNMGPGGSMGGGSMGGGSMNGFNGPMGGGSVKGRSNGKTNANGRPMSPGGMTMLMNGLKGRTNGRTNGGTNGGGGGMRTTPMGKTSLPRTTTSAPVDEEADTETDNNISTDEQSSGSTESPAAGGETPVIDDNLATTVDSVGSGEGETTGDTMGSTPEDSQRNIDSDNEIDNRRAPKDESTTTSASPDASITEINPAAEEVTDTPTEGGTTTSDEEGKDEGSPDSEGGDQGGNQDVQITEKDGTSAALRSGRARFLLYRPRFRSSAQLARIRVNPKRGRFLPVLSSRNGVTRRLVATNNKKRSKRLRASSGGRRSSVRRKSPARSTQKRGQKRNNQVRSNSRKKSNRKKATSPKKKNANLKRANNRRKQSRSHRRRGGSSSRRSRSQRRNRRLIVLRNAPLRKHHN